jgi:ABC-type multidrug transport system fused ATPase/permease subunit
MAASRNHLFLTNLDPLLSLGSKRSLQVDDIKLQPLPDDAKVAAAYQTFQLYWKEELLLPPSQQSLWRALLRTIGYSKQTFGLILSAIGTLCTLGPPQILRSLSLHFRGVSILPPPLLWSCVALLLLLPIISSICSAHSYVIFSHSAVIIRSALISAIYQKSFVISNESRSQFTTGRIMNLFGSDVLMIQNFIQFFGETIFAPAQLGIAFFLIYREVGTAMFIGLSFVLFILPILMILFVMTSVIRRKKSYITDQRISLLNEMLNGIRIIKYYSWEMPFSQQIEEIRQLELKAIVKGNTIKVIIWIVSTSVAYVFPIVIFYAFTRISNRELDTTVSFTTLALLGLITAPLNSIPTFLERLTSSRVAVRRIISFLLTEEVKDYIKDSDGTKHPTSSLLIEIKNVSAGWLTDNEAISTEDLDCDEVTPGYAIVQGDQTLADLSDSSWEVQLTKLSSAKSNLASPLAYLSQFSDSDCDEPEPTNESAMVEKPDQIHTPVNGSDSDCELTDQTDEHRLEKIQRSVSELSDFSDSDCEGKKKNELDQMKNRSIHTLTRLNFSIPKGKLVAIIGDVGSGKSSVLSLLLGDIKLHTGSVTVRTKNIAYHSQQPWILNATVRDNILCGLPLNDELLEIAIKASSLRSDLKILSAGLDTEIGEKGINLSGGQVC